MNVGFKGKYQVVSLILLGFSACIFCCGCNSLFYYPSKEIYPLPPKLRPPSFSNISLMASDGVSLHGRVFLARKPIKGVIVQFHGNAENLTSHSMILLWVLEHGYHLFSFDYRGYGQSESSPSPEGIRLDATAALRKAVEIHSTHSPQGKLIVIGQSLGGTIALRGVLDFPKKDLIDLVVVDSSFASYKRVAFNKMASNWFSWPFSPLAYLLISDKTAADLTEFRHPLLVIHSKNDPTVPFECSEFIYNNVLSTKKLFWKGEEQGHILGLHSLRRRKRFLKLLSSI